MAVVNKVVSHRPTLTDAANSASMKGIQKGVALPFRALRMVFDGMAGTSSHNYAAKTWRDKYGNSVAYNPLQKTGRRAMANLETMFTGKRTHANTREVFESDEKGGIGGFAKRNWNRGWAGVHFVSNMTIGMAGASLGWGINGAAKLGAMAAFGTARPMARFIGGAAYETAGTVGEMVRGTRGLSRNATTSDMMMLGAFGVTAVGGLALATEELSDKKFTGYAEEIPGTYGANPRMVDTGANGDLVFALHNMR